MSFRWFGGQNRQSTLLQQLLVTGINIIERTEESCRIEDVHLVLLKE